MLEILYLLLPIVVYSDLYQHGAITCINRQLSYTSIATIVATCARKTCYNDLQCHRYSCIPALVADTILLGMRALRLYSIEYYSVKPKQ